MKIKVQRIDKDLPLPKYETQGSVGLDLIARVDTVIEAGKIVLVPGNLVVEVPEGYMLVVASRSSTPMKKGLIPPHGIGIIDQDYCGPEDEIKIQVYNFTDEAVEVKRGDRIAQAVFVKIDRFELLEEELVRKDSRGGFGSTG
jgi:dUTP pyrophosphatase